MEPVHGAAAAGEHLLLVVLHRLRLSGSGTCSRIAGSEDLSVAEVMSVLTAALDDGLVKRSGERDPAWSLTTQGRSVGEKLLHLELDWAAAGRTATVDSPRTVVGRVYEQFLPLNAEMLALCTRWQVKQQDPVVLNDHGDEAYDNQVIDELKAIHRHSEPLWRMLSDELRRFDQYERRFNFALTQVRSGHIDWLTKPTIDSYHTIWFELHEDLLATLGLDRASEHARVHRDRSGSSSSLD